MSVFCFKKLKKPIRLGERLKKARVEKGWTLEQMYQRLKINERYLHAIEEDRFMDLPPSKVFRLAYVKNYAKELGVDVESDLINFTHDLEDKKDLPSKGDMEKTYFYSLSNILRRSLALIVVFTFIFYLVWQVRGILEPPKLVVFTPVDGYITSHLSTLVQGEAEKECKLTINGQEVRINEKGQFEFSIDLANGLNTIIISATKKHGKTSTVSRYVVSKQDLIKDKVSLNE